MIRIADLSVGDKVVREGRHHRTPDMIATVARKTFATVWIEGDDTGFRANRKGVIHDLSPLTTERAEQIEAYARARRIEILAYRLSRALADRRRPAPPEVERLLNEALRLLTETP